MAEAILRDMAGDRFKAYSAGTHPRDSVNPMALRTLEANGIEPIGLSPKHMDAFQGHMAPQMDFVFTVCNQAANEECPTWEGQPISGHWGLPDPAYIESTARQRLAFEDVYSDLKKRLQKLAALDFDGLSQADLKQAAQAIHTAR